MLQIVTNTRLGIPGEKFKRGGIGQHVDIYIVDKVVSWTMMSKWGQPTPDKMHFPLKLVLKWNYRQCRIDTDILTLPQGQMKNKTYITNSDVHLVSQTTINKCSLIGEEHTIGALATHFLTSPWQQTGKLAQNVKHNPLKKATLCHTTNRNRFCPFVM